MNAKLYNEILDSDRFSCIVTNIVNSKNYSIVTVEEPFSKSYVYFGKVPQNKNINIGDILYIGAKKINNVENDKSIKVTLYDNDGFIIDWTLIY